MIDISKDKPCLASGISQLLDTTMVEVTITVEDDSLDTGIHSLLGDVATDLLGDLSLGCLLGDLEGAAGSKSLTGSIVDHLSIYLAITAEYRQAWSLGSAGDILADALLDLESSFSFSNHTSLSSLVVLT